MRQSFNALALLGAAMPLLQAGEASRARVQNDDGIAVYVAVLDDVRLTGRTVAQPTLVIKRETVDPSAIWQPPPDPDLAEALDLRKRLSFADRSTVESFLRDVHLQRTLPGLIVMPGDVTIEADDVAGMFGPNGEGWDGFFKRFPTASGLVSLSAATINPTSGEALVYVGRGCGLLCGQGHVVFLKHEAEGWRIARILLIWES